MVVCTKLVQWLTVIAVIMEVWYGLISGWMGVELPPPVSEALLPVRAGINHLKSAIIHHVMFFWFIQLPLYMIMCFGVSRICVSLATCNQR